MHKYLIRRHHYSIDWTSELPNFWTSELPDFRTPGLLQFDTSSESSFISTS